MNSEIAARNVDQSTLARRSKNAVSRLAGSALLLSALLVLGLFWAAVAAPKASVADPLADDTLLVQLAPHADRDKAKADLLKDAQATTIRDMHVDREDYSILILQPPKGQRESTFKKIETMMKTHPEIVSVKRNSTVSSPLLPKAPRRGRPAH